MLSISSKCTYGMLAVLSLADNYGQGLLQIKDIAKKNNIPSQYLGQIFNVLVKADIIDSVRGKSGGYELSRDPDKITALELLEVLEGEIAFTDKSPSTDTVIQDLFLNAEKKLQEVFNVPLAELLRRQKEKNQILTFDI